MSLVSASWTFALSPSLRAAQAVRKSRGFAPAALCSAPTGAVGLVGEVESPEVDGPPPLPAVLILSMERTANLTVSLAASVKAPAAADLIVDLHESKVVRS